ncbi:MAG: S8 family serine peptidase [Marinobacter sp.]|nr:S8 family serine peptidase [Marinobacter sp.]
MIEKKKSLLLAAIIGSLALTGCGGGSDDDTPPPGFEDGGGGGHTATPKTEIPPISRSNSSAKALINAPDSMSGANIIVAVGDSGVFSEHTELEGTMIDGRSAAFATEMNAPDYKRELVTNLPDDYRPDDAPNLSQSAIAHGTGVSSLIFGENTGLLSDGTLLAMDIMYRGSVTDGDYDPVSTHPDLSAAFLATEALSFSSIDFINLSISGTGTYVKPGDYTTPGDISQKYVEGIDVGVIGVAGNMSLDFSEVFASTTPKCTEEEWDAEPPGIGGRCYAIEFWRGAYVLIPLHDDELREQFIFAVAVDNNGRKADFSGYPGENEKIQQRFISAPGVSLDLASHQDTDRYSRGSGTSYAAPIITAAAAAVKSKFSSLSSAAVFQALLDTADDTFAGYNPNHHGMGILDIGAALNINPLDYID